MVENGLEKSISFAIERGSIISDGDKPVKTIMDYLPFLTEKPYTS